MREKRNRALEKKNKNHKKESQMKSDHSSRNTFSHLQFNITFCLHKHPISGIHNVLELNS